MSKNVFIGLDVGGTKVEGAVAILDPHANSFTVLSKIRIPLPSHHYEHFLESIKDLLNKLIEQASVQSEDLKAVGVGLPGSINPNTLRMINGNTQFLIDKNFLDDLKLKLGWGTPFFVENDANLFTLAEAWGGVGKIFQKETGIAFEKQIALGITLGTGVGGGLVNFGKIYSGASGGSLEVGHICLDTQGRQCYCHQFGCAETYLSGTALQHNRFAWSSQEIFSKYREENINAEKLLKDYREKMLLLLRTLANLFNPHYFVFGGGLSNQAELFLDLKEEMDQILFLGPSYAPDYYINELGDGAGMFGAMVYSHEKIGRT